MTSAEMDVAARLAMGWRFGAQPLYRIMTCPEHDLVCAVLRLWRMAARHAVN